MDTTFYEDGILMIRWTDNEGNTWTAGYEEVEVFGKECFEQMPEPEDNLGPWSVEFKTEEHENEPDFEKYESFENWYKDWDSWLREQEIC